MTLRVLAHSGCDDGTCPTFLIDDETGDVWVRGYDPADPAGERETEVRIPAARWSALLANLGR